MDNRSLIFANLLNGVPTAQVAQAFNLRSEDEALQVFQYVLRKIKSYCFLRARQKNAYPIIVAHDVKTAQAYKLTCLTVLPKLKLDTAPQYKDIHNEMITEGNVMAVTANLNT
jgi:hypothetical protein